MTIGRILLVVFFIVIASGALAQIDPDPDGLGIYFDEGATVVSVTVPQETPFVNAYLILTNPSVAGNLSRWAAGVSSDFGFPGSAQIYGDAYHGFNVAGNQPGSPFYSFEVFIDDSPPFPTSEITILAGISILPYFYNDPIYFNDPINLYVTAGNQMGYETDLGSAEFQPSSGSWDLPVAVINGPAPVAVEPHTWGQVKSLYR